MFISLRNALESMVSSVEPIFAKADDATARRVPAMARAIIKTLGLDNVNDFGVSVVALSNGARRMKSFSLWEVTADCSLCSARRKASWTAFPLSRTMQSRRPSSA